MSVTVTVGMIIWNQGSLAPVTLAALMMERQRLEAAGYEAHVDILDNASWDGTWNLVQETIKKHRRVASCQDMGAPASATTLRNLILDRSEGDDYVAFIDGDIEIVPHSLVALLHALDAHPSLSAMAMDPLLQRSSREEADSYCRSIGIIRHDPLMYLCGYGIFHRNVFDHLRFDEEGPLGQCGWGSEDDDLWLQMLDKDYAAAYAGGCSYYHPEPRSSWRSLEALGIDPRQSFADRRAYVQQKWRDRRSEKVSDRLTLLEAQHVRPR